MIDKQDFYHGAALVKVIEDKRCLRIEKCDCGYVVNEKKFLYLKYKTDTRTPWSFVYRDTEVRRLRDIVDAGFDLIVVMVCGGDGICAVDGGVALELIKGNKGSISVGRKHREKYSVHGSAGKMKGKASLDSLIEVLFDGGKEE